MKNTSNESDLKTHTYSADSFAMTAGANARLAVQNELLSSHILKNGVKTSPALTDNVSTSSRSPLRQDELPEVFINPLPLPTAEERGHVDPSLYLAQPKADMILDSSSKNQNGKTIYKCRFDNCNYESNRKYNTLRHISTHDSQFRVKCRVIDCGASFVDTYIGKEHLASAHGIGTRHKTEAAPAKQSCMKRKGCGESTSKATKRKLGSVPLKSSAKCSPGPMLSNDISVVTSMLSPTQATVTTTMTSTVVSMPIPTNNKKKTVQEVEMTNVM